MQFGIGGRRITLYFDSLCVPFVGFFEVVHFLRFFLEFVVGLFLNRGGGTLRFSAVSVGSSSSLRAWSATRC